MIQRILKKDMKRRKSVNIILFLFITIASIFLSSSINNILVVTSAVEYYMDYAKVPDINFIVSGTQEKEVIDDWIEHESPNLKSWGYNTVMSVNEKDIKIHREKKDSAFKSNGVTTYIGTMNAEYCKVYDMDGRDFTLKQGEAAIGYGIAEDNKL